MNHPPYHLRPNKAVDRFLLIEVLKRLAALYDLSKYTYYGLGGPFLEDCRLLNDYYSDLDLVSLEKNEQTYKRQCFHKFAKNISLQRGDVNDLLATYSSDGKEIFWLDYTDLKIGRFDEFRQLLGKAEHGTVVKITLRAQRDDSPYHNTSNIGSSEESLEDRLSRFREKFEHEFDEFFPRPTDDDTFKSGEFPGLIQKMVQIATEKALPTTSGSAFQPLHSAFYTDGTLMLSVMGIVCDLNEIDTIKAAFKKWTFANIDWHPPYRIDVPVLSVKERLLLEKHLPLKKNTGKALAKVLGYRIGDSQNDNLRKLQQYADFYRYYPYFAKVTI